ncbi:TPA: hypothetical protein DCX16_04765 [bacterium]|nr:hypothetical protein [bacterium]
MFFKVLFILFLFANISYSTITTGIILTPTGNVKKQNKKIGFDLGFVYYIGDIIKKEEKKEITYLNPIKSFYFFCDSKLSPINGISGGGSGFVILKGSQPEVEHKMGGGGDIGKTDAFGFLYIAGSKQFKKNTLSCGFLYGPIHSIFNPIIQDRDKHIKENRSYFLSFKTHIFKRDFGIEAIKPVRSSYILFNTSIEKFLGFSFSFLYGKDISSFIGYFGIRLNVY